MPTIEELGQKVKAKYPGQYDDMADDEVGKKVKAKYPDAYKDFTDAAFKQPKSVRERATANLAAEGTDRAGAKAKAESIQATGEKEQAASDKAAYGQFASTMTKGAATGAASLFTGGLALGPALALMGGASLAGSVVGQGIEEATGTHKSLKERAGTAALDTALGVAGEGAGRGIGYIGKTLVPKMAAKAAATTERGNKLFNSIYKDVNEQLVNEIRGVPQPPLVGGPVDATPRVDVGAALSKAYKKIGDLPGKEMGRFGGPTDKVNELMSFIESKLETVNGQVSSHQKLDSLIEMKRSIQAFSFAEKDINRNARPIIQDLASDLNSAIKGGLKNVGPKAEALYDQSNKLVELLRKADTMTDVAKVVIKKMTYRLAGSALGADVGYRSGGSKGAAAGAVAGIAAPEISALVLEQIAAHPGAAKLAKAAVQAAETGAKNAPSLMQRAIELSGADETIKQTADDMKSQQFNISQ